LAAGNETVDFHCTIIVRDLRRRFGVQQVLDGVNLGCPQGKVTTIVGPSDYLAGIRTEKQV
jgi:ABC-type transporter Mla maintaining outer membrane lipid asymmetry ATPase subunit MlaF